MKTADHNYRKVILILLPAGIISLLAMGLGTRALGPREDWSARPPALIARSNIHAKDVTFCLEKDWGDRLSLQRTGSPEKPLKTTRLHNPVSKISVDVTDLGDRREIRAYSRGDRPLSPTQSAAINDCATSLNKALGAGFPKP